MPRDRDNPIREYFEEELPEKRFHEQNKRLQLEIDRNLGWDRDGFKEKYREIAERAGSIGLSRTLQSLMGEGEGLAFVRWRGCLWHLAVDFDRALHRLTSCCGHLFDTMKPNVEAKVDTDPSQALVCMECWEVVEEIRVAMILGGFHGDDDGVSGRGESP